MDVTFYRRRLPHWQPENTDLFITWRLHGSLPKWKMHPVFVKADRYLDQASFGPTWLRQPEIAEIVTGAIRYCATSLRHFDLLAWVIMANHVHMLVTPQAPVEKFMRTLKCFTASKANAILGRKGEPFWQHESYDHWVRDGRSREKIVRYIEFSPVQAGIVTRAEDYRWSSAWKGSPGLSVAQASGLR